VRDVPELVDGYRRFLTDRYPQQASLYRELAESGQAPSTMVISCCDSRVDPSSIFSAGPGQLFIVRNVANLAPPFEPHGHYHATSAALEFAVTRLEVSTILVLGHGRCGGVRAYLDGLHEQPATRGFIDRWMSLLDPAWAEVMRSSDRPSVETRHQALEHASVRHSIENLLTFPFIADRVNAGRLRLCGASFDIADGKLLALDPDSGAFTPVA